MKKSVDFFPYSAIINCALNVAPPSGASGFKWSRSTGEISESAGTGRQARLRGV